MEIVLNDAKGRIAEIVADGGDLQVIPLSAVDADADLEDGYAGGPNIDDVLGDAANTEQTAGGWDRKLIANANITLTVDDAGDRVVAIIDDQVWAGPTAGNDVVALLVAEDVTDDTDSRVLTKHDFAVTADGNEVTADFDDTDGFWNST